MLANHWFSETTSSRNYIIAIGGHWPVYEHLRYFLANYRNDSDRKPEKTKEEQAKEEAQEKLKRDLAIQEMNERLRQQIIIKQALEELILHFQKFVEDGLIETKSSMWSTVPETPKPIIKNFETLIEEENRKFTTAAETMKKSLKSIVSLFDFYSTLGIDLPKETTDIPESPNQKSPILPTSKRKEADLNSDPLVIEEGKQEGKKEKDGKKAEEIRKGPDEAKKDLEKLLQEFSTKLKNSETLKKYSLTEGISKNEEDGSKFNHVRSMNEEAIEVGGSLNNTDAKGVEWLQIAERQAKENVMSEDLRKWINSSSEKHPLSNRIIKTVQRDGRTLLFRIDVVPDLTAQLTVTEYSGPSQGAIKYRVFGQPRAYSQLLKLGISSEDLKAPKGSKKLIPIGMHYDFMNSALVMYLRDEFISEASKCQIFVRVFNIYIESKKIYLLTAFPSLKHHFEAKINRSAMPQELQILELNGVDSDYPPTFLVAYLPTCTFVNYMKLNRLEKPSKGHPKGTKPTQANELVVEALNIDLGTTSVSGILHSTLEKGIFSIIQPPRKKDDEDLDDDEDAARTVVILEKEKMFNLIFKFAL